MEQFEAKESSNVGWARYYPERGELEVDFKNKLTGVKVSTYVYDGTPDKGGGLFGERPIGGFPRDSLGAVQSERIKRPVLCLCHPAEVQRGEESMIKFAASNATGEPVLGIGLSAENWRRLLQGQPILLRPSDYGMPWEGELFIMGGATEGSMTRELAAIGALRGVEVHPTKNEPNEQQ